MGTPNGQGTEKMRASPFVRRHAEDRGHGRPRARAATAQTLLFFVAAMVVLVPCLVSSGSIAAAESDPDDPGVASRELGEEELRQFVSMVERHTPVGGALERAVDATLAHCVRQGLGSMSASLLTLARAAAWRRSPECIVAVAKGQLAQDPGRPRQLAGFEIDACREAIWVSWFAWPGKWPGDFARMRPPAGDELGRRMAGLAADVRAAAGAMPLEASMLDLLAVRLAALDHYRAAPAGWLSANADDLLSVALSGDRGIAVAGEVSSRLRVAHAASSLLLHLESRVEELADSAIRGLGDLATLSEDQQRQRIAGAAPILNQWRSERAATLLRRMLPHLHPNAGVALLVTVEAGPPKLAHALLESVVADEALREPVRNYARSVLTEVQPR